MSFEKVDVDEFFQADEQNAKILQNMSIDVEHNKVQTRQALLNAYAEIDRMVVALHASEATLKDCQAENDRLTAMLDQLRGKQAAPELVWKCPVSLKDGEYRWHVQSSSDPAATLHSYDSGVNYVRGGAIQSLRDWTDPPRKGVWRVVEPGKAVWVRE